MAIEENSGDFPEESTTEHGIGVVPGVQESVLKISINILCKYIFNEPVVRWFSDILCDITQS